MTAAGLSPAQARALLLAASPGHAYFSRRQLDYIGEGVRWVDRSRLPGEDFHRCMREARACAKLASLCGRLAVGGRP